jgi:hypothetical protein
MSSSLSFSDQTEIEESMSMNSYLVSPLEIKPMLSNGSCFTGFSLSHGVDDLRVKGGGIGPAMLNKNAIFTCCTC